MATPVTPQPTAAANEFAAALEARLRILLKGKRLTRNVLHGALLTAMAEAQAVVRPDPADPKHLNIFWRLP